MIHLFLKLVPPPDYHYTISIYEPDGRVMIMLRNRIWKLEFSYKKFIGVTNKVNKEFKNFFVLAKVANLYIKITND